MKNILIIPAVLCALLTLFACSKKEIPPPQWGYEKDAVKIQVVADPMLNQDNKKAHTLYTCFYQLKDPNGFNQLCSDQSGLYKLLACKVFDSSVASSKHLIVNPGETTTIVMNRAESAKYLALVAGYYTLEKDRITRLVEIPVVIEEKGFFSKERKKMPAPLDLTIYLGPEQIDKVETKAPEER
nr:type VI secretion system lipoprotein TssJ [uncultured Desulfobacter sp.]